MRVKITNLTKINFNEVVNLIIRIMHKNGTPYTRSEAMEYLSSHASTTIVLEVNDEVMGMYAYTDNPNNYTLNFFALNERVRKKKIGFELYKDMKNRLNIKPVIISVHSGNLDMINVVKKRGTFIGRFPYGNSKTMDYYSIDFSGKEWKK